MKGRGAPLRGDEPAARVPRDDQLLVGAELRRAGARVQERRHGFRAEGCRGRLGAVEPCHGHARRSHVRCHDEHLAHGLAIDRAKVSRPDKGFVHDIREGPGDLAKGIPLKQSIP